MKVSSRRIKEAVKSVLRDGQPKDPDYIYGVIQEDLDLSDDSELRSVIWNLVGKGEIKVVGNWKVKLVK